MPFLEIRITKGINPKRAKEYLTKLVGKIEIPNFDYEACYLKDLLEVLDKINDRHFDYDTVFKVESNGGIMMLTEITPEISAEITS
jgi:hypothetical protein